MKTLAMVNKLHSGLEGTVMEAWFVEEEAGLTSMEVDTGNERHLGLESA